MLALPLTQWISLAVLDDDTLARGDRLEPARVEERRQMRGGLESVWRTAHYDVSGLAEGAVLIATKAGGRWCEKAYVLRGGEAVEIAEDDAEDLLDPAGARRRAWDDRVRRSGVPKTPFRYRMDPGHGWESDTIYDWYGTPEVAACVRATERYVWIRAVTYAEAVEVGII